MNCERCGEVLTTAEALSQEEPKTMIPFITFLLAPYGHYNISLPVPLRGIAIAGNFSNTTGDAKHLTVLGTYDGGSLEISVVDAGEEKTP